MIKTASEIETDLFAIVLNSGLLSKLNGSVYLDGLRPENSQNEDVVVSFLAGVFIPLQQEGKLNINVYVPNKKHNNILRKNTLRCREVERICQDFANNLPSGKYKLRLGRMIQTFEEKGIQQHYVNVQLDFLYNYL